MLQFRTRWKGAKWSLKDRILLPTYMYVYVRYVCIFLKTWFSGLVNASIYVHTYIHTYCYISLIFNDFQCRWNRFGTWASLRMCDARDKNDETFVSPAPPLCKEIRPTYVHICTDWAGRTMEELDLRLPERLLKLRDGSTWPLSLSLSLSLSLAVSEFDPYCHFSKKRITATGCILIAFELNRPHSLCREP